MFTAWWEPPFSLRPKGRSGGVKVLVRNATLGKFGMVEIRRGTLLPCWEWPLWRHSSGSAEYLAFGAQGQGVVFSPGISTGYSL